VGEDREGVWPRVVVDRWFGKICVVMIDLMIWGDIGLRVEVGRIRHHGA